MCHCPDRRSLDRTRGPAAIPLTTGYKANGSTALGHPREARCGECLRLRGQPPVASQGETGGLGSADKRACATGAGDFPAKSPGRLSSPVPIVTCASRSTSPVQFVRWA